MKKTWKDRRCSHGLPPETRIQLDLTHCNTPGCLDEVLASLNLKFIKKAKPKEGEGESRG
jgi:hypothetical protein